MAKRVRGQRSTHRPGGAASARPDREPSSPKASATGEPDSTTVSAASIGEPVAATAVATSAVTPASARTTGSASGLRPRTKLRSSGLDQKAAAETEWVTDDLKRIAVISAIMIAGLAIAWILLVVVGLGDFY